MIITKWACFGELDNPSLPFNRAAAEVRLQHLKKRFSRDPSLESKYRAVINEYVDKGYARKLTSKECSQKKQNYLVPTTSPSF